LALIAAVLFGISTPLVQKFGSGVRALRRRRCFTPELP
jgi:hypothetical protein